MVEEMEVIGLVQMMVEGSVPELGLRLVEAEVL